MSYQGHFDASVQYNDWKGTSAADRSDHQSIEGYMRQEGLMSEDDYLLSISFYSGEGSNQIRAFLYSLEQNFENVKDAIASTVGPVPVREVRLMMTNDEFLGLFKRFDVTLHVNGMNLNGRQFETQDE
jgi:hypothetical protein